MPGGEVTMGQTLSQERVGNALIWVWKHSRHGKEHKEVHVHVSTGGMGGTVYM